jgi:hypothetical protein
MARLSGPGDAVAMTIEVHTENGIEGGTDEAGESPPDSPWPMRVAWLVTVALLIGVMCAVLWMVSADASAPGGCGGGG